MRFNTDGIILREQNSGEADRIITILTREKGVIRAFAKGARRPKNKLHSGTQLLCYGNFIIYAGKSSFSVEEAQPAELFYNLRNDIELLSLAQYFCEISFVIVPEGERAEEFIRLFLNSLHFLANSKRPKPILKSIFEMRIISLAGYMPNLVACEFCGDYKNDVMFFDMQSGLLYCQKCKIEGSLSEVTWPVLKALRHIVFSPIEKLFNFTLAEDSQNHLSRITESYLLIQTQHRFSTLDFYKTISNKT